MKTYNLNISSISLNSTELIINNDPIVDNISYD